MAKLQSASWLHMSWLPGGDMFMPDDPGTYRGPRLAYWITALYLVAITARSLIHLFLADGGAHSIATMDLSVGGGANIIALFGQWGAIQLLLAGLLWVLLILYPGLLSLVLLVLLTEPYLRGLSGQLKPVVTVGTAPGAALNYAAVPVLLALFYLSLCPAKPAQT